MELMISADGGGERDDAAMAVSLAAGSDSDRPMDRRSRPYWHGNKQRPVRSPRESSLAGKVSVNLSRVAT